MSNTASSVLQIARGEIGYSRAADPQRGSKYGRWYGSKYGDVYVEAAWCYMFVSWVFDQAGASSVVTPGAYCPTGVNKAKSGGRAVSTSSAQAGDIVFFDWGPDGVSDHVGIVESNNGSYLTTIEGNTGGGSGYVQRRTRAYSTVCCVCRPSYGGTVASPPSTSSGGSTAVKTGQAYLKKWGYDIGPDGVDGVTGPNTRRAAISYVQYNMNAYGESLRVDGTMNEGLVDLWKRKYGPVYTSRKADYGRENYLYMVKAVQIGLCIWGLDIGPDGIDGYCGANTTAAIRKFQQSHSLSVDGVVGPDTFREMFRQ